MENIQTFFATLALAAICSTASAQGFSSFKTESAIVETLIKDKPEMSVVETIVLDNCDITNLPVKYKLWSGCSIDAGTPLSANYSKPQIVNITKSGADSKKWAVAVHQLKGAALPLNISFSEQNPSNFEFTNPKPWATYNVASTHPTLIRLQDTNAAFYVAYDGKAKKADFDVILLSEDPFAGELIVESSVDGKNWNKVTTYSASNPFKGKRQSVGLPADARFVRWIYSVRQKQNIHLNNITIE